MVKRYAAIWFSHLTTDWFAKRNPGLGNLPFVLVSPSRGRMLVNASNAIAEANGVLVGMAVADAKAAVPTLQVMDNRPGLEGELLKALGLWCIRYAPIAAINPPDGLILDVTGCPHLWGGEQPYLQEITTRLLTAGYNVRAAMADTVGAAWAVARFGRQTLIVETGGQAAALLPLPPSALRLEQTVLARMQKLGLSTVGSFISMPRKALLRRFGQNLIDRLDQALGHADELVEPLQPLEPYQERLPCLEPILTLTGIEIALGKLLDALCQRLKKEGKGLRTAIFKGYRADGKVEAVSIGTNRATYNTRHLFKLFEINLQTMEPAMGIELFTLEAAKVEDVAPMQEALWGLQAGLEGNEVAELLDRMAGKLGAHTLHRYLPDEHYWPERSFKLVSTLGEKPASAWQTQRPRPIQLLTKPEQVEVTAPIPDYPPMLFRYKDKLHKIKKADGPERIEREWWLEDGPHRDYYCVEDEEGQRYWLFRSGHYEGNKPHQWFIHGFFA